MPKRKRDDNDKDEEFDPNGVEDVVDGEEFEEKNSGSGESDSESSSDNDAYAPDSPVKEIRKPAKKKRKVSAKKEKKSKKKTPKRRKSSGKSKEKKGKNKVEEIKDDEEAAEYVLEYLLKTNRPYSMTNLLGNLRGVVKKKRLTTSLESLEKDEKIQTKKYKKTVMFQYNQDNLKVLDEEQLEELAEKIKAEEKNLQNLKAEVRKLEKKKKKIANDPTTEELKEVVEKLQKTKKEVCEKYDRLSVMDESELASPEEKKLIVENLKENAKIWRERKVKVKDVVAQVAEGRGKKDTFIMDEIGIEKDEDCDVNMKEISDFLRKL